MARPIAFAPDASADLAPDPAAARREADALLDLLHRRGILKLAAGLLGGGPEISAVAVDFLNREESRRALQNLVVAGKVLVETEPAAAERLAGGLRRGVGAAAARLDAAEPPGLFALFGALRDPDVRRALSALLTLLKELGAALPREGADSADGADGD